MMGRLLQPQEVPWGLVEGFLTDACFYNGGRYKFEDCKQEIQEGKKQLWIVEENGIQAVIVSAIIYFPQKKCGMIDICTGNGLFEWGNLVSLVEDWARNEDCDSMFLIARPGMEKLLKQQGYTKTHSVFEKDL